MSESPTKLDLFNKLKGGLVKYVSTITNKTYDIPANDVLIPAMYLHLVGRDLDQLENQHSALINNLPDYEKFNDEQKAKIKKYIKGMVQMLS